MFSFACNKFYFFSYGKILIFASKGVGRKFSREEGGGGANEK